MANRKPKTGSKPRPKLTPKSKAKVKKVPMYVSVRVDMYHPFQKVTIPLNPPGIQLERDSWLDSQIGAGIVKEL